MVLSVVPIHVYSTDNTENANPSRGLVRGEEKERDLSNKSGSHTQKTLAQPWQQMPRREGVQAVLHHTENSTHGGFFFPKLSILSAVPGAALPQKYPLKAPGVIAALETLLANTGVNGGDSSNLPVSMEY